MWTSFNDKCKRLIFLSAICFPSMVAAVIPATSFAQIRIPNRPPQAESAKVETKTTTEEGDKKYLLNIVYLNGFKLNKELPPSKSITLTVEGDDGEKQVFTAPQFKQSEDGASLVFKTKTPPHGHLKVYLCRKDQCQILRKEVRWES